MENPKKFDQGKLMYHLFPVEVHEQVIQGFTYGANKYGETEDGTPNWRKGNGHNTDRLLSAAYRHIAEYRKGNLTDPENGIPHLTEAICNLIMIQDIENGRKNTSL